MRLWVTLITFVLSAAMATALLAWFGLPYQPLGSLQGHNPYVSEGTVTGRVFAQGRPSSEGIEVSIFHLQLNREIARFSVSHDGHFQWRVEAGPMDLRFSLPGYLSASRQINVGVGEIPEVGDVKLLGGDTDGNERIDSDDLRRLGSGGPGGSPNFVLDINGDGLRNVFDLALAGLNLGRGEEASCPLPTPGDPDAPTIMEVQTKLHDGNNLIIDFDVLLDTPASIYIDYHNPGAGSFRSMPTDGVAAQQNTSIVRLRPLTTYCYEVFGVDDQGRQSDGFSGTFLTGPLPAGLRDSTFNLIQGKTTYPVTFISHVIPDFHGVVAVDSLSNVVWYFQSTDGHVGALDQDLSNWNLIYASGSLVREITPLGELTNESPDVFCEPFPPPFNPDGAHHEVLVPVDGKVLYLGRIVKPVTIDGVERLQMGDTIREWDQTSGTDVEVWDPFLFLDPANDRTASSNTSADRFWDGCDGTLQSDDWTHANSIQVVPDGNARSDEDGNVVMSVRHLNQIISISPDPVAGLAGDGTVLAWELGDAQQLGEPTSDFLFPEPSDQFYHQHSARQLPNGNILLLDNGNGRPEEEGGLYTRALELALDFDTMTATKVWEYRHNPDLYAACCSNVTRLDESFPVPGNTVMVFGANFQVGDCCRTFTMVEVDQDSNVVAIIEITAPGKSIQYRVYPTNSIYGETKR